VKVTGRKKLFKNNYLMKVKVTREKQFFLLEKVTRRKQMFFFLLVICYFDRGKKIKGKKTVFSLHLKKVKKQVFQENFYINIHELINIHISADGHPIKFI